MLGEKRRIQTILQGKIMDKVDNNGQVKQSHYCYLKKTKNLLLQSIQSKYLKTVIFSVEKSPGELDRVIVKVCYKHVTK